MDQFQQIIGHMVAQAARASESRRKQRGREWVAVFMNEDTIVIALHGSLTDMEKTLMRSPAGGARVRHYHRNLFASVTDTLALEIKSITGMVVRHTTSEINPTTGCVVQFLTTDTVSAQFMMNPDGPARRPGDGRSAGTKVRKDAELKVRALGRVITHDVDKNVSIVVKAGKHVLPAH
jgi:uncharacterized protein YbcI